MRRKGFSTIRTVKSMPNTLTRTFIGTIFRPSLPYHACSLIISFLFPFCLSRTYQIRAIPTTTHDNMLCVLISHAAVHGAYAGFTGYSAGPVNGKIALIPLQNLSGIQKKLDTSGSMWQRLRMSTGQPNWIISDDSRKQIEKRRA